MESASEAIWNPGVAGFVLAAGTLLTIATVFVQGRRAPAGVRAWLSGQKEAIGAPLFLASSASMGSITGAALAVTVGGPGALVWMWIATLVGLAIPFGEASLAARSAAERGGVFVGGAKPLGAVLGVLFAVASIVVGLAAGGLFQGHEVASVWRSTLGTSTGLGGAAVAAVAAAIVFVPAVRRSAFVYLVPMAIAVWVGITLTAAFADPLLLELALGDAWNQAFAIGPAAAGAGSGAITTVFFHGVLYTVMGTEIGATSAAMAEAESRSGEKNPASPPAAGAAAMLVPLITCGLVSTCTALALLGAPAEETALVEATFYPLERTYSRGLRPSRQAGQTIVLPEDSTLEPGKHYDMMVRSNPRGHRFARLIPEENAVILPAWQVTESSDAVVFRSKNSELAKRAAWDVRVPCEREVLENPSGGPSLLKLSPKEEGTEFKKVIAYFELDPQPYVPVGDFHFPGFVSRGTSPDESLGEHLAMYEQDWEGRPYNPKLHEFFRAGFRGPYGANDDARPPWGMATVPGYTPEIGTVVPLKFRADPRGNALVSVNRVGTAEGPPWDLLMDVDTLIVRHATDPAQDIRIPVTTKLDAFRVRFTSLDPAWESFAKVAQTEELSGPYALIKDQVYEAEVHSATRLPATKSDRRSLVAVHHDPEVIGPTNKTPYRPHPWELVEAGVAGPFTHREGVDHVIKRVEDHAPGWGSTVFALIALVLGATSTAAWSIMVKRAAATLGGATLGAVLGLAVIALGLVGAFVASNLVQQWAELAYAAAVGPTLAGLVLMLSELRREAAGGDDADS